MVIFNRGLTDYAWYKQLHAMHLACHPTKDQCPQYRHRPAQVLHSILDTCAVNHAQLNRCENREAAMILYNALFTLAY